MARKHMKLPKNVARRFEGNPTITLADLPFQAADIHNAGAVKHNGEYVLLVTVENLQGYCSIYRARSRGGRQFEIDPEPILAPSQEGPFAPYETNGVRDARITPFGDTYYIIYLAHSEYGWRLALAKTDDFESIERVALISEPDTKSGVLFPRKINGRYARLERPREGGSIWISYSEDLVNWGGWDVVMTPRGGYWDSDRIGAGVPPIEVECGWMLFYYGEKFLPSGPLFRLGVAFLDREDPTTVIGRSNVPLLAPHERYERIGDVNNLVFACGAVMNEEENQFELYYGASNSCICLSTVDATICQQIGMARFARGD